MGMHFNVGRGDRGFCIAAMLAVALTGCGNEPQNRAEGRGEAAGPSSHAPSNRRVLPIEAYMLSDDERGLLQRAKASITRTCMKSLGIDYSPPPAKSSPRLNLTDRRYGLVDTAAARDNGYHLPNTQQKFSSAGKNPLTDEQDLALWGGNKHDGKAAEKEPRINGVQVPKGGCMGAAERGLSGGTEIYGEGDLAVEISKESFNRSRSDSRVREAIPKWSLCMKKSGYPYTDPLTSGEDVMGKNEPSRQEKAVAVVDAECNNRTELAEKWFAVECEIQKGLIAKNRKSLDRLRKLKETEIASSRKELSKS